MSLNSSMFPNKPHRIPYVKTDPRNRKSHDSDSNGIVIIVRTIEKGLPAYEVTFPDNGVIRFHSSESKAGPEGKRLGIYQNGEVLDQARSAKELEDRLYHAARKYAYRNAGGCKVHDTHRQLIDLARIELK